MFQPLKGVRVVDLTQVLAGPFATYQLALMGAEVLKIEKPGAGEWTRTAAVGTELSARKMGLAYLTQNSNKSSVTIDIKTSEGMDALRRLIKTADVFVENFKPGVAERLGLGFDDVKQLRPDIVYCSVSAFGQDGPFRERGGYDHIIQGMCGIMLTTGAPGSGPTKVGAPYVDYATGMNAAMAVLAGLLECRRTGEPQRVDVALLDTSLILMSSLISMYLTTGWTPVQTGNEAWSASPSSGAFETSDGSLMLAANTDEQFARMCKVLAREDLIDDLRWHNTQARAENGPALRAILVDAFKAKPAAEWEEILNASAVPAGRIRGMDEMLKEEQIAVRGLVSTVRIDDHDDEIFVPAMGYKANGESVSASAPPPELGADTHRVLQEIGYSEAEIAHLQELQAI